jgi:hypothetical protein
MEDFPVNRLARAGALALAVLLIASVSARADDAKKDKKKAKGAFIGTVVEVKKESGKDEGSVTIKGQSRKQAGEAAIQKTFKVTATTKVQKVAGNKKNPVPPVAAKFADVEKGSVVAVVASGDNAGEIRLMSGKQATKNAEGPKKKKNKKTS